MRHDADASLFSSMFRVQRAAALPCSPTRGVPFYWPKMGVVNRGSHSGEAPVPESLYGSDGQGGGILRLRAARG